jgi:hypothetical protein
VVPGNCNDRPRHPLERLQQANDLLALATIGDDHDGVVGVHHAEVAVQGPRGVEQVGAGAGRVERADQLLGDVRRLADSRHADPAVRLGAGPKPINRGGEGVVQVVGDVAEGVGLVPEQVARPVELSHLVHLGGKGRHGRFLLVM